MSEGRRSAKASATTAESSDSASVGPIAGLQEVDRVARAIYLAFEGLRGLTEDDARDWQSGAPWDSRPDEELCEWERDEYRELARAAIAVIDGERRRCADPACGAVICCALCGKEPADLAPKPRSAS